MSLTNSAPKTEEMPGVNQSNEQAPVEQAPEQQVEQEVGVENEGRMIAPVQETEEAATAPVANDEDQVQDIPVEEKSEDQKKVESILSDGLADLYSNLPDNRKAEFKQKGEQTASQIVTLLQAAKVKVGKVVDLIKGWLTMIPGVNKFFLEQESKIKADRLLEYKKDKEEGRIQ